MKQGLFIVAASVLLALAVRRIARALGPIVRCYQPGYVLVREGHAQ
jgi:hypothetical protein